jgi:hypothetical protein
MIETDLAILNFLQRENDSLNGFTSKLQMTPNSPPLIAKKPGTNSFLSSNPQNGLRDKGFKFHENKEILDAYQIDKEEIYESDLNLSRANLDDKSSDRRNIKVINIFHSVELDENEVESVPLPPSQYSNNVIELSESTLQVPPPSS